MTKKLSELFNLPDDDDGEEELNQPVIPPTISAETLSTMEKIDQALPAIRDLDTSDGELDEYSAIALEAYRSLMDLGMQVDPRFSAEIFNSSSSMFGHALDAKKTKINKKIKMLQLQLQKAELERKLQAQAAKESTPETPLGTGKILDRNEIIRQILEQNKNAINDK